MYEFAEVNCVFHLKTGEKYTKKFNCAKTKEDIFVVSLMDLLQKERFYCVVMEVNPLRVTIINTGNIDRIEVDHE